MQEAVMNISNIGNGSEVKYDPYLLNMLEIDKSSPKLSDPAGKIETASTSWQREILLSGLDKLENSLQMDDIHPLDRAMNQPIESFEEAMIELSFLKTPDFTNNALGAQANINPKDVWSMFTEDQLKYA
jgi:hypothetical protein